MENKEKSQPFAGPTRIDTRTQLNPPEPTWLQFTSASSRWCMVRVVEDANKLQRKSGIRTQAPQGIGHECISLG
jgi:hypothetical protein